MNNVNSTNTQMTALRSLLRLIGSFSLLALFFVFAPYSLMNQIHSALGMGTLSHQPVVGYLARSTSAFYTMIGGLMWLVSFDLVRHRVVVNYLCIAFIAMGGILTFVDWFEGMPTAWKYWEGPFIIIIGVIILVLNTKGFTQTQEVVKLG